MTDMEALVRDIMDELANDPTAYTGINGVLDARLIDDGVGIMDLENVDGNIVSVIVIAKLEYAWD